MEMSIERPFVDEFDELGIKKQNGELRYLEEAFEHMDHRDDVKDVKDNVEPDSLALLHRDLLLLPLAVGCDQGKEHHLN